MKRHILWAVLMPFAFLAKMMAQPTASTPTAGQSYYIYNVGQKQYMAADSEGNLTLSATGMAVTLTQADATVGTWYLTTPMGRLSGTVLERTQCDGSGMYQEWKLALVSDGSYTIAMRNSGVNAYSYLEYNDFFGRPIRNIMAPDASVEDAQWIFVSPADYEQQVVTLDQAATTYETPTATRATVHLIRNFSLNMWNSFCVPFAISADQLKSQFGSDARIAAFTGCTETTLQFTTVEQVEAGVPYLVYPTAGYGDKGYYEFTDVTRFVAAPQAVTRSQVTYTPSFVSTTAPQGAYVLSQNVVYHLASAMTMKGFRAYFVENSAAAKISSWTLDGVVTGIEEIEGQEVQPFDVYNMNGQKVRSRVTTTDHLPQGVYIVNGKKVIIK
ncbi:MAG: T9SS type A sorting domain-containing protein [Prevotella sp.]